jgi:hypothetical protein
VGGSVLILLLVTWGGTFVSMKCEWVEWDALLNVVDIDTVFHGLVLFFAVYVLSWFVLAMSVVLHSSSWSRYRKKGRAVAKALGKQESVR